MNLHDKSLIVVFTDLDGCLLDHHSYDHRPALPALKRLKSLGIPVLPVTSKTLEEIRALPFDFGAVPLISENGMVTDIPDGFLPRPYESAQTRYTGKTYEEILAFLEILPAEIRALIKGFADMSAREVSDITGLDFQSAVKARVRQASEPFLWSGDEEQFATFKRRADKSGLQITRGGRFFHLMAQGGKVQAMAAMLDFIVRSFPGFYVISIALGDSENDKEMLASADYGVVIPNDDGSGLEITNARGHVIRAPKPGPEGWGAAILRLLDDFQLDKASPFPGTAANNEHID